MNSKISLTPPTNPRKLRTNSKAWRDSYTETIGMARRASSHPTDLEMEILKVLWRDGPSAVRHVRDQLVRFRDLAHTSVSTIMNIMVDKGYLTRIKQDNRFIYEAEVTRDATTRGMLRDLVQKAFDGSAVAAMVNLLDSSDLDGESLKHLRAMINRKAKEQKP
jgi:predicted transcriptional regulator